MIKNSIFALTAAALVAGVAVPSVAATSLNDDNDGKSYLTDEVANDYTLVRLHEKGIKATSVEEWNGRVRAFVTQEDGSQAMQLFDADTLAPVGL